ncbi:MAG TPA: hypothetical protein DDW30_06755 [Clostridiales bacterium]|nr:hypothetical protein [Clostridiales bacterium]
MKKLWKRILAIAMLAVMLLAAVSCGDKNKEPAKTEAPTKTEAPAQTTEKPEDPKPPVKERDVPYEDQTEDDVVNDNF